MLFSYSGLSYASSESSNGSSGGSLILDGWADEETPPSSIQDKPSVGTSNDGDKGLPLLGENIWSYSFSLGILIIIIGYLYYRFRLKKSGH